LIVGCCPDSSVRYIAPPRDISPCDERSSRMTADEVMEKVRDIIAERLDVKRSEVVPTASFIDDLNADSLDIVELVMGIEKDFDIEIPDDEAEKIRTVQDAVDYIVAHVS
jgi:acyl carrier protein